MMRCSFELLARLSSKATTLNKSAVFGFLLLGASLTLTACGLQPNGNAIPMPTEQSKVPIVIPLPKDFVPMTETKSGKRLGYTQFFIGDGICTVLFLNADHTKVMRTEIWANCDVQKNEGGLQASGVVLNPDGAGQMLLSTAKSHDEFSINGFLTSIQARKMLDQSGITDANAKEKLLAQILIAESRGQTLRLDIEGRPNLPNGVFDSIDFSATLSTPSGEPATFSGRMLPVIEMDKMQGKQLASINFPMGSEIAKGEAILVTVPANWQELGGGIFVSPEVVALQGQVEESKKYTLVPSADSNQLMLVFTPESGSTTRLPGFAINPEGTMTLTVNGKLSDVSNFSIDSKGRPQVVLATGDLETWDEAKGEWVQDIDLSPNDKQKLDAVDPEKLPKKVSEGSAPAKLGIPLGAKLTVQEGTLVYVATNPAGEDVVVGQLDVDGNLEKGDAISYSLCLTPEEAVKDCKLPLDFVMRGGPAQIAKLTAEPFPVDVTASVDIIKTKITPTGTSIKLRWSPEWEQYFEEHPERRPVRIRGYYTTQGDRVGWGKVEDWQLPDNPNGTKGDIRTLSFFTSFDLRTNPSSTVFPGGGITSKACKIQPYCDIGKDPVRTRLIEQWAEQNYPPEELEKTVILDALDY